MACSFRPEVIKLPVYQYKGQHFCYPLLIKYPIVDECAEGVMRKKIEIKF
jgi:hypothetical protein